MRYVLTFFWTFLLMHMMVYVVASMSGSSYSFTQGTILGIAVTVLVLIIPAILPKAPSQDAHHH
ncbi:YjzD family protein [Bacillus massiliglaciei]|uniref:YjzD family protein n=1 Tax=Bacillus massiliglaciei TaxID=1816693 RepID=UPI000DA5EC84|nr:YjzD family protein [Bacillus massiliglaciei]